MFEIPWICFHTAATRNQYYCDRCHTPLSVNFPHSVCSPLYSLIYFYGSLHSWDLLTLNQINCTHISWFRFWFLCDAMASYMDKVSVLFVQSVPLATEPGISLIILAPMNKLQRKLNRSAFFSSTFFTQWCKSDSNFVAKSSLVVKLLKKCQVR